MFKPKNNGTEFNFWPSIADTLLAIFMVFLMLWLVEKIIFLQELGYVKAGNEILNQKLAKSSKELEDSNKKYAKSEKDLKKAEETIDEAKQNAQNANNAMLSWQRCEGEKQACEKEKARLIDEKARLSSDLENCNQQKYQTQSDLENCNQQKYQTQVNASRTEQQLKNSLRRCESDKARYLRDKPPIIRLSKKELDVFFDTGEGGLSNTFKEQLRKITVPKLITYKKGYNVNLIEVIGHTDGEIANKKGKSNLDQKLENAVARSDISGLRYGSNADLGLIRALAVAFFLRKQPELSGVKFRVYSAAQLILPDGELANKANRTKDDARRRIEIRFTNLED
jgi:outer membrane protein OmpA-like peptidoglycan-associated protein